jgi:hypothetical protein
LKHIRERSIASRAGLGESLVTGLTGLGSSVLDGLVGVVAQPLRGAQESGMRGFLTGTAMGAINIFLKPIGGAMELVSRATQGALISAGGGAFSLRKLPATKKRTRLVQADIRWRRKVKGFVRAFECVEALVLLTKDSVLLVVQDVIQDRISLLEPFVFHETYSAGTTSFTIGKWTLTLAHKNDRREFAQFFKRNVDIK